MKAIELVGYIDDRHRLSADVPNELRAGPVRLIVLFPEGDEANDLFRRDSISKEWTVDLEDPRRDLYTLEDGLPPNAHS